MANSSDESTQPNPDYPGLVRFLLQPLLDVPDSLRIDCEPVNQQQRIWIRLAFEGEDRGRVLGRGGRNLQAIQQVLTTAAALAGKSVQLEIYDPNPPKPPQRDFSGSDRNSAPRRSKPGPRRPPRFSADAP